MIKLEIAIYEGDSQKMEFDTVVDLCDYIKELKSIKGAVWLVADDVTNEVLVTESIELIIVCINADMWNVCISKYTTLYIQEYASYEAAYSVALSTKETNPLCYNKD